MNDWDDLIPKWRQQGRTGPGPIAPKYASRKDRRKVRNGGTPGMTNSNPGGPGGRRRRIQSNKARGKTSHRKKKGGGIGCAVTALILLSVPIGTILAAVGTLYGYGVI